jgi:hypothetical protein
MTPAAAIAHRSGEVAVEVDGDGTRQMPGRVQLDRRRAAEPPPHVQHDEPRRGHATHGRGQLVGIDQHTAGVHQVIFADPWMRSAHPAAGSRTISGDEPEDS